MNTRDLEAFLAVVETGSIVGASARLHLTQPGISRRVQTLEGLLGVTLLDRQSKPLKPTAAGREAYEYGRRMLGLIDDLKTRLAPDGIISGDFRLGITPYLSEVAMAAPLDRLRETFPDLILRVTTGWPDPLIEQLRRGEIDAAAFCLPVGSEPPDEFNADPFDMQPLVVVGARAVKLPFVATLQELAFYPWIVSQDGCGLRSLLQHRFEQERLALKIGIEALGSDLRLSLAARGVGITMATPTAVEQSAVREKLQIIRVENFVPRVKAWLVYRSPAGRLAKPLGCLGDALKAEVEMFDPKPASRYS